MQYTHQNERVPCHPAGGTRKFSSRVDFARRLKLESHGSRITSDAGLLAYWALDDDALGLTAVVVPRSLFKKILNLIDDLRQRPAPAKAGDIDSRVKTTEGVCLNVEESRQMAYQARAVPRN